MSKNRNQSGRFRCHLFIGILRSRSHAVGNQLLFWQKRSRRIGELLPDIAGGNSKLAEQAELGRIVNPNVATLGSSILKMKRKKTIQPFAYDLGEEDLKRTRHKARELRDSQWWKRRLAKGVCHYCGRSTPPKELTMDHIVPVSRGGKSTRGNVAPCCKECNTAKKQLLPMEWEQYLEQFDPTLF